MGSCFTQNRPDGAQERVMCLEAMRLKCRMTWELRPIDEALVKNLYSYLPVVAFAAISTTALVRENSFRVNFGALVMLFFLNRCVPLLSNVLLEMVGVESLSRRGAGGAFVRASRDLSLPEVLDTWER